MKKHLALIAFLTMPFWANAQLNSASDSLSYAIGVNIGESFQKQGIEPDVNIVAQAIKDYLSGNTTLIEPDACIPYIQNFMQAKYQVMAGKNLKAGEEFLEKNKGSEGVQTTSSGLQYVILKTAEGPKPTTADRVKVHYHGTLIDGTVFDSSVDRGTPATFGVTQVIKGWIEGLQLMNTGAKYRFFIPSALAYGPQGPPKIGPNQVLIFDVE